MRADYLILTSLEGCSRDGGAGDGCAPDGSPRRVAQTDGPWRKRLDGRVLRFHGFSSQGHPSVPLVLAVPISETDSAETDVYK